MKSGRRKPITMKKGFSEYEFKVGDEILSDRIPVGQCNAKRWNLQNFIAMDMTPRVHPEEFRKQMLNRHK